MSTAARLALFYAALFVGSGASSPNAGLWFKSHGLSGAAIGLILAAPALGRAFSGPLVAHWADGFRLRRTPLALIGLGVAACYVGLALARGFWAWAALWFAAGSLFANLSPLADVIALRRARAEGFNYGWPRGFGSAAFVAANVGMGLVLTWAPPSAMLVWVTCAAAAVAAAARWLLPNDPVHETGETLPHAERWRGAGALLRDPVFMLAVGSVGPIQASHGFYYGFSVLAWRAQGLNAGVTGALWGVGVTAEVVFLWFLEPWRRRVGPERLVLWGGTGAVVRWVCLAFAPPLWALVLVQTLHALTFTATFIGSLRLAERLAPKESASAAQTLNSVLSGGFLIGFSTMAAGRLFDIAGVIGYVAMSGIALLGLVGALCLGPLQRARRRAPDFERA
jgi:PPP family 3-phenylpropionic acid transporter